MAKEPIRVLVSGAAGQIGYSLIPLVCSGQVFGNDQPVCVHLLDITPMMKVLNGVAMEIQDCAYPLVRDVVATDDYEKAFTGVQFAMLVGGFPRRKGMLRKDLLQKNASIYSGTGEAVEKFADKNIKILVVANPANTNALILSKNAPSIPKGNISCLTRLDMNRAKGALASRLGRSPDSVANVIIWGNHSKTQVPDASHATVDGTSLSEELKDDEYLNGDFIPFVQNRGAEVIAARGLSSAMSAACGIKDHMHDWYFGTKEAPSTEPKYDVSQIRFGEDGGCSRTPLASQGEFVPMGVYQKGDKYGITEDIFYSMPVTIKDGKYTVVDDLNVTDAQKELLKASETELVEERGEATA